MPRGAGLLAGLRNAWGSAAVYDCLPPAALACAACSSYMHVPGDMPHWYDEHYAVCQLLAMFTMICGVWWWSHGLLGYRPVCVHVCCAVNCVC